MVEYSGIRLSMRGLGFGRFDVFTRSHSSMPGCGSSGLGYGESTRLF